MTTCPSTAPASSRSRQIKIGCCYCGYLCRSSRIWINLGVPKCPNPQCSHFDQPMIEDFPPYVVSERTRRAAYGAAAAHGVRARHVTAINEEIWGSAGNGRDVLA